MFRQTKTGIQSRFAAVTKRFARDTTGAAAIEFAFIAPLLITLYLGTMEVSQGIEINKKVGRAGSIIGDLVAQSSTLDASDVDDILKIGAAVLQPYTRSTSTIKVTAIQLDSASVAKVMWSRQGTGSVFSTPYAANLDVTATLPANLKIAGSFLIRVESQLEYLPITSWSIKKNRGTGAGQYVAMDMSETYYLRPRISPTVTCTGC